MLEQVRLRQLFLPTFESRSGGINSNPEVLWDNLSLSDLNIARLQIGNFCAFFPSRPKTSEGIHFILSPRSDEFETLDTIGYEDLRQIFIFLLPHLEKPEGIIGLNESFNLSASSSKSLKQFHMHALTTPLENSSSQLNNFSRFFKITDKARHYEDIHHILNFFNTSMPELSVEKSDDRLGITITIPESAHDVSGQLSDILLNFNDFYRQLSNDTGTYSFTIKKNKGTYYLKLTPTTHIKGFSNKKYGFIESAGHTVQNSKNIINPKNQVIYRDTLTYVYKLLSIYLNGANANIQHNWHTWYESRNPVLSIRVKEQIKRHSEFFNEILYAISHYKIDRIYEIGVGSGVMMNIIKNLCEKNIDIIGIDLSIDLLKKISDQFPLINANTFHLPIDKDSKYKKSSLIFHQGLVEHFDLKDVISMLKHQLEKADTVIFSVPSVNYVFKSGLRGDERLFSLDGWLNILSNAGFIVKGRYYGEEENEKYHVLLTIRNPVF